VPGVPGKFAVTRLLSRQRQRDNRAQPAVLAIAQFDIAAVIERNGPNGCEAQTNPAGIAVARAFGPEKRVEYAKLERPRDTGTVLDRGQI